MEASNATLFCELRVPWRLPGGVRELHAVYKPIRGERPLDDFPDGTLAHARGERLAGVAATGFGIVPPTVIRDGPAGKGMVQLWIDVGRDGGRAGA